MAKFKSTTFGSISGKHGTAVAVVTKDGKNYMRLHRDPSNPRTEKQVRQRTKFAFTVQALRPFNRLFKEVARGTSGMQQLRSGAFRHAIVGTHPDYELDYQKLMFSYGTVEGLYNLSATIDGNTVNFAWENIKTVGSRNDDEVCVIFYNEITTQTIHETDWTTRQTETAQYELPEAWSDASVCCWVYLKQGNARSNSQFVGGSEFGG